MMKGAKQDVRVLPIEGDASFVSVGGLSEQNEKHLSVRNKTMKEPQQ